MAEKIPDSAPEERLQTGMLTRADVARRLGELAFGRANDCVKLVLEDAPDVDRLDLSLLCEVKRSDKGAVEVKLADRLQALSALLNVIGQDGGEIAEFLSALQGERP